MTRINAGIPVSRLNDGHLVAEHKEIIRICSMYRDRLRKNKFGDIPKEFTLGTGHVTFFLDKGAFTLKRYKLIHKECLRRGFNVTNFEFLWNVYTKPHMNNYNPTTACIEALKRRTFQDYKPQKNYFGTERN